MDRRTHHTAAATCPKTPHVAQIMVELEMTRIEVDGMLDRYTARVLDEWLMPLVDAALDAPEEYL